MKKIYRIKNLGCANCAAKMERKIKKLDGVHNAAISFMTGRLTIEADDDNAGEIAKKAASICRKIEPDCRVEL